MSELFRMWRNTRMVVLTAVSAALYAAILIPFKVLPVIPGVTELRPANAVPIVCSLLFGPAAAWGSGMGNLIGDCFGGIGPGSIFGFFGNFLYGWIPYRLWIALGPNAPAPGTPRSLGFILLACALASGACALVVGWGIALLGFVPFQLLANIILVNNLLVSAVLAPPLLRLLHDRVQRLGLTHQDVLGRPQRGPAPLLGISLACLAVGLGLVVGNLIAAGQMPWLASLQPAPGSGELDLAIGLGLLPFVLLLLGGLALT